MAYCPNCKTRITCGCQNVKCKDGTQCCTNCVRAKNAQIDIKRTNQASSSSSPTNINANYRGPGKQL